LALCRTWSEHFRGSREIFAATDCYEIKGRRINK